MDYPLISEYREAILSAEDNFNELASLRPVLDGHGDPVMSSGNFAVVFKMKDENDGKLYAIKCFIKDQEGRDESYRKIADELEVVSSSYVLPLRYLEDELFVDSPQCDREEFPVVVMEWVEGETLDAYLKRHLNDKYELEMLSYRFNRMSAWLLAQPFAHGDLKPDNILVRRDGSLVLVDYDGMFVPSMKGEKARELGSPDYRHPLRTDSDFNEHIDDFSISVIALSLKAIALNPQLKSASASCDSLLLCEKDFQSPAESVLLKDIQNLTNDFELSMLLGIFYVALAKNSLEILSFRLFMTEKPKQPEKHKTRVPQLVEKIDTKCTDEELAAGVPDEFGVLYSPDGKRLLKCDSKLHLREYEIKSGSQVICDEAFDIGGSLQSVVIPDSVTSIGNSAFSWCESLQRVKLPASLTEIGTNPFSNCPCLKVELAVGSAFRIINNLLINSDGVLISCLNNSENIMIPKSVTSIGDDAFFGCWSLRSVVIPESVTSIGEGAFWQCWSLQSVEIPNSVISIGEYAFYDCRSLQSVVIPESVTSIGECTFEECESLQSVVIPESVTSIGDNAFFGCWSLERVKLPASLTKIGKTPFSNCPRLRVELAVGSAFRLENDLLIDSNGVLISCLSKSKRLDIPDSVTSIGDGAFSWCGSLQSISIPDSVTSIGNLAFDGCELLQSISIPDSVTAIGNRAFNGCESLQSVAIPTSVKNIGKDAFPENCKVIRR